MEKIAFSIHQPMVSARGEIEERPFKMLVGKTGRRWFVACQEAEADNIYVEGGKNSQGMGGATCPFLLESGETVNIQGPWKTGADGLFGETGYDAREKYTSQGIIALGKEYGSPWPAPDLFTDVLHHDKESVIGAFDRIENMAQEYANKLGKKVWMSVVTAGGGHAGWKDPEAVTQGNQITRGCAR